MELTLDYFSVTLRPLSDRITINVEGLVKLSCAAVGLLSWLDNAPVVSSSVCYEKIYRLNDISLKVSSEEKLYKQGIMFEFTSNGLSNWGYEVEKHNMTIIDCLRAFRAFTEIGIKVNTPRIDIAMDDICRGTEKPILHMRTISEKWRFHGFCSRSRAVTREEGLDFKFEDECKINCGKIVDTNKNGVLGRTVYFGCRKSAIYVRFYDKLAEQKQRGLLDDNTDIKHWVRCEYELHQGKALTIFNMLCDYEPTFFASEFARVVMGHLRFIEFDDSNRSRCSVCSWWLAFLDVQGKDVAIKFPSVVKPVRARRTLDWFTKSLAPSLYALIMCMSDETFFNTIYQVGSSRLTSNHIQLINDFNNNNIPEGELSPCDVVANHSFDRELVLRAMREDYENVRQCADVAEIAEYFGVQL